MYKGLFITGTDTGVGKTYISSAIARAVKQYGLSAGVMKPLSSGDRDDARALIDAAGVNDPLDLVNPVFFRYPLSPLASAELEGKKKVSLGKVWSAYARLKKKHDFMIVEGIGGLLVPIARNYYVSDMIKRFRLPAVVVARPALGTINHTLLTVDKLREKGIAVAGIILSSRQTSTLAEKTNPEILRKITRLPVLEVPFNHDINLEQNLWLIGER